MKSLMISKTKIESNSLKITNNVLCNPKFYNLLNGWLLDASKGNIDLKSYFSYSGFCSIFSIDTLEVKKAIKQIYKPTSDGNVVVVIYRTPDYMKVVVKYIIEKLEIIEDKD